MHVTVCYALPDKAFLQPVELDAGATIGAALSASGLLSEHPEVEPDSVRVGIFGKLKTLDTEVREGDRIEVYRALQADPKTARRRRVQRTRQTGTREGQKWMRGGGDSV